MHPAVPIAPARTTVRTVCFLIFWFFGTEGAERQGGSSGGSRRTGGAPRPRDLPGDEGEMLTRRTGTA